MLNLVVMKDSFELRCPSLQNLQESQRNLQGPKKGAGRARWAERKWKLSVTHKSRSKAEGMIPGESLRSFLGEGASETERESPWWLSSGEWREPI